MNNHKVAVKPRCIEEQTAPDISRIGKRPGAVELAYEKNRNNEIGLIRNEARRVGNEE